MENPINTNDMIFALDIGTRSIIGTVGVVKEKKFRVIAEKYIEHEERAMIDGQIHDITLVATAVQTIKNQLESEIGFKLSKVSIAAAGRFLRTSIAKATVHIDSEKEIDKEAIRSLELTAVKSAEEDINKHTEGKLYCVGYTVKNYYLNGYIISNLLAHKGEEISAEVIATFLPRSVVDSLYSVMKKVNLEVMNLTLEPIAAIEAAIPKSLRLLNLALVDIGAGTSDIAISSKDTITAFGMVPMAGDEVTETIAQTYLVDFNTAEEIKKQCMENENITYVDVLGIENTIASEEVIKVIVPIVEKITDEIAIKIIDLNGGKAPNAVFLVGGGAHTPKFRDVLAEKLNLPVQRIGIKGRDAVTECICIDNNLGSVGVTVLGIALISIKNLGHDFIDVFLNEKVISLFNSHAHSVMDVVLQGGINPKLLMGKNGRNIRFTLNGSKRLAFGTLGHNATISINGKSAALDSEVKEGDNIQIGFAQHGKDAEPKVLDYITNLNSISFFYNDIVYSLEPLCFINGEKRSMDSIINEEDKIEVIYPSTVGDFIKYFMDESEQNIKLLLKDKVVDRDYEIKEGDRIYKAVVLEDQGEEEKKLSKKDIIEQPENNFIDTITNDTTEDSSIHPLVTEDNSKDDLSITLVVNDKKVKLKDKEKYIFIDIFDYIDFDLTVPKGNIKLELNGKPAGYYDELNSGDDIKIYWE